MFPFNEIPCILISYTQRISEPSVNDIAQRMLQLHNEYRKQHTAGALQLDDEQMKKAQR